MRVLAIIALAAFTSFATPAAGQDVVAAIGAYRDLQTMCAEDRGRLWGADLCGPLLVADPATRGVWASERADGLSDIGTGWSGQLPQGVMMANTSVDWAGRRWVMVLSPLPADETDRRVLVAHEAWHRIQGQIGVPMGASDCAHLEQERARVLMRLEFRALATALRSRGRARDQAARHALMFRAARLAEFPAAASQEAALDRNEGLASYTGVRLGVTDNPDLYAARTLDEYDRHEALARSYAYASGPAYGLLLDREHPNWRFALAAYAPADLLAIELRPRIGDRRRFRNATARYGGEAITAEERERARARQALIADLRQRFSQGPRLELPLRAMEMELDPNQVTPVEGLGTVYGVLTIRDVWGELRARQGALISSDFTRLTVAGPDLSGRYGPGWELALLPGYTVAPAGPDGVQTIIPVADADRSP